MTISRNRAHRSGFSSSFASHHQQEQRNGVATPSVSISRYTSGTTCGKEWHESSSSFRLDDVFGRVLGCALTLQSVGIACSGKIAVEMWNDNHPCQRTGSWLETSKSGAPNYLWGICCSSFSFLLGFTSSPVPHYNQELALTNDDDDGRKERWLFPFQTK